MSINKVFLVASVESHLLNFHIPSIELLLSKCYEVHVATKLGNRQQEFDDIDVVKHNIDSSRTSSSPKVLTSLIQMEETLK